MPRLSRAQEESRQQIARLTVCGLAPEDLSTRLLLALQLAIPADMQMLFGIDPDSLLINRLLAVCPLDSSKAHEWFRKSYPTVASDIDVPAPDLSYARLWLQHSYLVNDFAAALTFHDLMRAQLTVVAVHDRIETSWGVPPQLFAGIAPAVHYHNFYDTLTPAGGGVRACFPAHGQWIAALQLGRLDATRPFQPTDVAFLRLLAPVIGQALWAAFERERATTSTNTTGPSTTGVLLLAPNGRVLFWTRAAETWIELLRDTWQPEAPGLIQLPTAVWSVIAQLRTSAESYGCMVRVPIPAGFLRIEASLGEGDTIVVVLAPERPPGLPELPGTWPLTPRERQVLSLLAQGQSNQQIAASLCVSEHTIESHLMHAYDKLGVHSRRQFLARLFHEARWRSF